MLLKDNHSIKIIPYVTYSLIIVNIAIFLYQVTLSSQEYKTFLENYAFFDKQFTESLQGDVTYQSVIEWLTLITSAFLHSDIFHIFFNMNFLYVFGRTVEQKIGSFQYLLFYLLCGIFSDLISWRFDSTFPNFSENAHSLGASGAIYGVMGAYLLWFTKSKIKLIIPLTVFLIPIRITSYFLLLPVFAYETLLVIANIKDGIGHLAHFGGFVSGFTIAFVFTKIIPTIKRRINNFIRN